MTGEEAIVSARSDATDDAKVPGVEWMRTLQARFGPASHSLSQREVLVIALRSGVVDGRSRTHEEVAEVFGVTPERIRSIEVMAAARLVREAKTAGGSPALAAWLESRREGGRPTSDSSELDGGRTR